MARLNNHHPARTRNENPDPDPDTDSLLPEIGELLRGGISPAKPRQEAGAKSGGRDGLEREEEEEDDSVKIRIGGEEKRPKTPDPLEEDHCFEADLAAQLQFSPPRSRTPYKLPLSGDDRPHTPPPPPLPSSSSNSPSKPRLQSPTKRAQRIPPSPHRPSIDAFWSQEVVNDWNDRYSPQKVRSPRKLFPVGEGDDEAELGSSPRKSPRKRDRGAIARRKAFDEKKHALARRFLMELDEKVAQGKVAAMAESAGGIGIVWSRKLNSTAGRANWKREALRSNKEDGSSATTYRHHASVELAEKVIDDEDRLRNVLAHEFCHLCTFMLSNVKKNPHGREFKAWAAKTTSLFSHVGIEVTTTHNYAIAYKYIWACTNDICGLTFKRHSKSIDPKRHTCGACKSNLVQVQPAPRKAKADGEVGRLSEYQRYVKDNFGRIKMEMGEAPVGEVMKKVGESFRMTKAKERQTIVDLEEDTLRQHETFENILVVDEGENARGDDDADDVARKLDFLRL